VVAVSENGVIGKGGKLPWHITSDLKHFCKLTLGKPVIMGRKTFESLGGALLGRCANIVVSRDPSYKALGGAVKPSLEEALRVAAWCAESRGGHELMVIGGGEIYEQALPLAHRIELTRVHAVLSGDTYFPADYLDGWDLVACQDGYREEGDDYDTSYFVYERCDQAPQAA
jgi:dihydrofolate reductase